MSDATVRPMRLKLSLWMFGKSLSALYRLVAARQRLWRRIATGQKADPVKGDDSEAEEDEFFVRDPTLRESLVDLELSIGAVAMGVAVVLSLALARWRFLGAVFETWREMRE
jgi:hypothetical protein